MFIVNCMIARFYSFVNRFLTKNDNFFILSIMITRKTGGLLRGNKSLLLYSRLKALIQLC